VWFFIAIAAISVLALTLPYDFPGEEHDA